MDIARFKKLPIMGILRGIDEDTVEPLMEAVISAANAGGGEKHSMMPLHEHCLFKLGVLLPVRQPLQHHPADERPLFLALHLQ